MDLLLHSYLYTNIISKSEIKILSNFIEKTFRIYQITKYNVGLIEKVHLDELDVYLAMLEMYVYIYREGIYIYICIYIYM